MALPDLITRLERQDGFILRNARLADASVSGGLVTRDVFVLGGKIERITAPRESANTEMTPECDLALAMLFPLPVDCHAHLDKGQIWARTPNPDHTFASAIEATGADITACQTPGDVRLRLDFMLDCAEAHGTRAIRSHVDAVPERFDETWEVMCDAATARQDRLTLQLAPFSGVGAQLALLDHIARKSAARDAILSMFVYSDPTLQKTIATAFDLAERHNLALDFHADENLDPGSLCLEAIADEMLKRRFEGRVLVGHCCSLAVQDGATRNRVLEKCAKAGLTIVSLPACNAYLQDRVKHRTPRMRGAAPVHEIRAASVDVAIASDNCRDPFHAYGDLDMIELFRSQLPFLHLDDDPAGWLSAIADIPASAMGLEVGGIAESGPADFLIIPARNWSEFGARPATERIVFQNGKVQRTELPEFSRLDALEGKSS